MSADFDRPEPITSEHDAVDLAQLISDEFGVSLGLAQQQIRIGMVTIDGQEWHPRLSEPLLIPRQNLLGREIIVRGRDRSFRVNYRGR